MYCYRKLNFHYFTIAMKYFIGIIFLTTFIGSLNLYAQRKKSAVLQENPSTGYGTITLPGGSQLTGRIRFNDNAGIVSCEEGKNSRSFNSKNVTSFHFFDEAMQRSRVFHAFEFDDPDIGMPVFSFFEVLKEFKTFAVLARIDPVKVEPRRGILQPYTAPALTDRSSGRIETSQTETIFFINDSGEIEPYLKIVERESEGLLLDYNRTRNEFIKEKLFEQYTGVHYNALVDFARDNELSFRQKKDLITILDRYEELLSN